ncbi:MAG: hypothetical protein HY393_01230 [Candidatus Diapherotrites archaeon]|nr:hypothetical protein [Candidatus Diapherotrites archaeon]
MPPQEHLRRRQPPTQSGGPSESVAEPARMTAGQGLLFSINRDIKALNASILVISQKIKYLVRNEKILGRNLIVLNKRIREIQTEGTQGDGASGQEAGELKQRVSALAEQVNGLSQSVFALENEFSLLKESVPKAEHLQEMKYVIDALNPLNFITVEQAKRLVEEEIQKSLKKKTT